MPLDNQAAAPTHRALDKGNGDKKSANTRFKTREFCSNFT